VCALAASNARGRAAAYLRIGETRQAELGEQTLNQPWDVGLSNAAQTRVQREVRCCCGLDDQRVKLRDESNAAVDLGKLRVA
jgi:hypothetical protein